MSYNTTMEKTTHIDEKGRKYEAWKGASSDTDIIIGPPELIVDELGLPEPFATNLHNVLFSRRIINLVDAGRPNALLGALQEALNIDVQRLHEAYFRYYQDGGHDE